MLNKLLILFIGLMIWRTGVTQTLPDSILYKYKFRGEIERGLESKEFGVSKASELFSYIGEYAEALRIPNEVPLEWGFDTLSVESIKHFKQFSPVKAVDAILTQAEKERIIIINEAHHKPLHRVFVKKLLKGLYERGFRYFGLEALSNCDWVPKEHCDSMINDRGYPFNSYVSGTYITEPQMSNLIREAHDLGFELFAYEKNGKDREREQAEYINRVLNKDPEAKILILCGWYHLLEEENRGKRWMASYLKEISNIDPFTIYQDVLTERYCSQECPLMEIIECDQEKLFINEDGEYYNGPNSKAWFDALIYHPRTRFIGNRPHWLVNQKGHTQVRVSNVNIKFPCLVKAYKSRESNSTVPTDIIELQYASDPTTLVLPKGQFRLEIENLEGEKQIEFISIE